MSGPLPTFMSNEDANMSDNLHDLMEDPIYVAIAMEWEDTDSYSIFMETCDACGGQEDILQIRFSDDKFHCATCFTQNQHNHTQINQTKGDT